MNINPRRNLVKGNHVFFFTSTSPVSTMTPNNTSDLLIRVNLNSNIEGLFISGEGMFANIAIFVPAHVFFKTVYKTVNVSCTHRVMAMH
jgi:hypothetical protein